ncbi:MAG: DUF3826 domain-containing protein [Bacteroidota bacterium]
MLVFLFTGIVVNAQTQTQADKDNYTKVITDRSAKYLVNIGITDTLSAKFKKAQVILVDQYRALGTIHDTRNAKVKEIKATAADDKAGANAKIAATDSIMNNQLVAQHTIFLSRLGKELNPAQVEAIKDEMTYKKLAVTYNAYLDELPQLTDVQKVQIKAWLIEAREKAIDGGSSDEKTAVFGKYKGRINNYLSAQGYDMKQAGIDWQKRLKEKAATPKG